MKKRLLVSFILMLSLACIFMMTAMAADTALPEQCQHCKTSVTWTKLESADIRNGFPTATGHYYLDLDESVENYNWMTLTTIPADSTVCIELNGEWIYGTTETFVVADGGTLNIMDHTGNGKITGRGRTNGDRNGGVLRVEAGGTANLYAGELSYVTYSARHISNGGVAYVTGELNMYGGSIVNGVAGRADTTGGNGGNVCVMGNGSFDFYDGYIGNGKAIQLDTVGGYGGNIYVGENASFTMYNGTIQGGTAAVNGGSVCVNGSFDMRNGTIGGGTASNAGGTVYESVLADLKLSGGRISAGTAKYGNCIYARDNVTLSGSASVDEVQLKPYTAKNGPALADMLIIDGVYTGTVKLRVDDVTEGMDVGNCTNGDISGANLSVYGSIMSVKNEDGQLITVSSSYCEHCKKEVSWTPLTANDAAIGSLDTGHYYLAFDGDSCEFDEINIYLDQNVCLNLNGKQLKATTRAFSVFPGGTLSIMGDGSVIGCGGEGKKFSGGAAQVSAEGTLNLYSGTIGFEEAEDSTYTVQNGGTLSVEGTFNMFGGEVSGGVASNAAGTIFGESTSTLNFYGGKVLMGTATAAAPCIYNKGRVLLAGDASVAQILLKVTSDAGAPALADMLTVSGAYTGTTVLRSVSAGQDIGISDGADLSNAKLTIYNKSSLKVSVWGSDLVVTDGSVAMSVDEAGAFTSYKSAQAAVDACAGTANKVVLFADVTESLNVSGNVVLDLNGKDVETVAVANGAVLYCLDATTADYDVSDGVFGKINAYTGKILAFIGSGTDDGYFAITEDDGTSFHRLNLQIKSMALKPDQVGLYFLSDFAGDQMVKEKVASFGVALSTVEAPNASNMGETALFTRFDGEKFNTGAQNTSSLLYGIMKPSKGDLMNSNHADIQVYGRAYVLLKDGTYLFGATKMRSLNEQLCAIDDAFDKLTSKQKSGIFGMYNDYSSVMSTWDIPTIIEEKQNNDYYATVEKTATQDDIALLEEQYADRVPYMGDMHDHANTGGKSDGKQNLTVWKKYMDILDMDFATIVDHKQARHMYLDEWDNTMFVGGSEAATWITDYTHTVDEEGNLRNGFHYNMIFANADTFVEFLNEHPKYNYRGEDVYTATFNYPHYTRGEMIGVVQDILDKGGFFTHVHPMPNNLLSEDPLDYWFGDWTGLEVIFYNRGYSAIEHNYKLWTDLLALGKKVYATAGSDHHDLPNPDTMSTFYTKEKTAQAFVDNMRAGNFTAGMIGIRMCIEDNVMGSQVAESFAGKRLVIAAGDFHSSLNTEHDYRLDLINDEGIVFSQTISAEEMNYFAVEAENCKFYRVEIHDTTTNTLIALGNPIWNAE